MEINVDGEVKVITVSMSSSTKEEIVNLIKNLKDNEMLTVQFK